MENRPAETEIDDTGIKFNELDEDSRDMLITDSLALMRTVTHIAGTDRGIKLWETIVGALGPEVKGAVFFSMLTGQDGYSVRFRDTTGANRIDIIKAIREATGLGLKEAKDISDHSLHGGTAVITGIKPGKREALVRDLRRWGCTIV